MPRYPQDTPIRLGSSTWAAEAITARFWLLIATAATWLSELL
jgi:hypothetical protein